MEKHDGADVRMDVAYFDKVTVYTNCTVQVLENTKTGAVSVGWAQNGSEAERRILDGEGNDAGPET